MPGTTAQFTGKSGVFDFDRVIFKRLHPAIQEQHPDTSEAGKQALFRAYVRYHLSDHRPVWAEFRMDVAE